jgi:hypothetical protein
VKRPDRCSDKSGRLQRHTWRYRRGRFLGQLDRDAMWNTDGGIRRLSGMERDLFVRGVLSLHEKLVHNKRWKTGVSVLDSMPADIKPCVLLDVAEALTGNRPAPELYAWNEGAVLAVFNTLEHDIAREIMLGGVAVRRRVHKAWLATCYEPEIDDEPELGLNLFFSKSNDPAVWSHKIERLANRILHDRDMEEEELFLDMPAVRSAPVKEMLGIPDRYFVAVPPVYTEKDRSRFARLLRIFAAEISRPRSRHMRNTRP